jgi:plastocyanin
MRLLVCVAGAVSLIASAGCKHGAEDTHTTRTHTIVMDATRFQPGDLTVKVGEAVVWVNKDPFPHTATSSTGGFDSHEIESGNSWRFKTEQTGDFPYVCTLHRTMRGTLHVR